MSVYYTEMKERKVLAGGGSPPPTGAKAGPGGKVHEKVRSYRSMGPGQPRDRSLGIARAKVYAQSKGL